MECADKPPKTQNKHISCKEKFIFYLFSENGMSFLCAPCCFSELRVAQMVDNLVVKI